jgi:hypothetical protein
MFRFGDWGTKIIVPLLRQGREWISVMEDAVQILFGMIEVAREEM